MNQDHRKLILELSNKACEQAWGYKKPPYNPNVKGQKWIKSISLTVEDVTKIAEDTAFREEFMRKVESLIIHWNEGIRHTRVNHPLIAVMDKEFKDNAALLVFFAVYDKESFKAQWIEGKTPDLLAK